MLSNYARYSVKLFTLLENEATNNALQKALSTYPLYSGKKKYDLIPTREELNKRLLNHYKYREIGTETIGEFLDKLEITMCEIMPHYNEIYKTVEIMSDIEDPFGNVDFTEVFEEERQSTGTQNGTSNNSSSSNVTSSGTDESTVTGTNTTQGTKDRKHSDTPQNNVENINNYLSEYTKETESNTLSNSENVQGTKQSTTQGNDTSETSTTMTDSATGTTRHTFTKKGNQGVNTYAHDMIEFRTSIIDVTNKIINDVRINELFMLVW